MYNHHEKGRAPDLESVLAGFMTYQASSKDNCYSTQQQGAQKDPIVGARRNAINSL